MKCLRALAAGAVLAYAATAAAQFSMQWEASTTANAGFGDFAPFYIASNSGGIYTQPFAAYERVRGWRPLGTEKRFDYGFGADLIAGASSDIDYLRYNSTTQTLDPIGRHAQNFRVQQLWAGMKYRGVYIYAGMKEDDRSFFNSPTSSGDFTISNNARPIPQVRMGFIDFQNIPFTNGWVQIRGDIAYGKFTDSRWNEDHFSYYTGNLTTGVWFHYKSCHFRTKPEKPFSVTFGMQHASQFGGSKSVYYAGKFFGTQHHKLKFRDFIDVFVQKRGTGIGTGGDEAYFNGNHVGSWDIRLRYRLADSSELTAYAQFPWEDATGIGKLNGFDGIWGLQYQPATSGLLRCVNLEFLTFMNQSGPIHWAPNDHPGTGIHGSPSGSDDYYNNYFFSGWQNYGMAIGSPFFKSPLYNTDGLLKFIDSRFWGFHCGIEGSLTEALDYRFLASYRKGFGTPYVPSANVHEDTSAMAEVSWKIPSVKGLSMNVQVAFDAGNMYGDNFGALASLVYTGSIFSK